MHSSLFPTSRGKTQSCRLNINALRRRRRKPERKRSSKTNSYPLSLSLSLSLSLCFSFSFSLPFSLAFPPLTLNLYYFLLFCLFFLSPLLFFSLTVSFPLLPGVNLYFTPLLLVFLSTANDCHESPGYTCAFFPSINFMRPAAWCICSHRCILLTDLISALVQPLTRLPLICISISILVHSVDDFFHTFSHGCYNVWHLGICTACSTKVDTNCPSWQPKYIFQNLGL